jgi:hypothetical protein
MACTTLNSHKSWVAEFAFSVTGKKVGGKGLAMWYVSEDTNTPNELFGKSANFNGMALIFDSNDVDHGRSIPFVHAVLNEGHKTIDDFDDYGLMSFN